MKAKRNKRVLSVLLFLLTFVGAKADVLPSSYYAEATLGTFYLYNVNQGQFLVRLSNNFPGLSNAPAEVKIGQTSGGYTLMFSDGYYLKTGFWNNQYLWTDGAAGIAEGVWVFEAISGKEKTYRLKRATSETWGDKTGTFYANGTNADTEPTEDCQWALIALSTYVDIAKEKAIPAKYRSEIPTAAGEYYLYDILTQQFLNTNYRSLSEEPSATTTFTPSGSGFLISGAADKYLKIGVYKGQYLWSDGDESNTKWTIEPAAGEEAEKAYYISTKDFTETNSEVAGKTMYLTGTNASSAKPSMARWALITAENYVAWASSGEIPVDHEAVAANLATIVAAKGDATSLVQNPTFAKSDDGWWGGERVLRQLYRGSGYDYESTEAEAELIQVVPNMPSGIYKVVAAVRGAIGTTATAKIAGKSGRTVENRGYQQSGLQLNSNGVMMPWSPLGGFSENGTALGWQWLTATGELKEDGSLNLEFDLKGADWKGIVDVHLYYMGDGETDYAMEYRDGVDAVNHAVTCDLTTQNPNRLFTTTGAIKTLCDATLNNNLVGGSVSKFVLWDGFDFASEVDFVASKATYYRSIEQDAVDVICAPFAITGGASGKFYEPKSVNGEVVNLTEVKKPEAGKAYIYQNAGEVTSLTGSGIVKAQPVTGSAEICALGTYSKIEKIEQGRYILNGETLNYVSGNLSLEAFRAEFKLPGNQARYTLNFKGDEESSVWKKPVLAIGDYVADRECYLYNPGAGRFYTEGNAYGTQASVGETGLKCKFVANGDAVKLTNHSLAKSGWRTAFVTTNGAVYCDGESPTECWWKMVPSGEKTFKLMMDAPNTSYNQTNYPGAMFGLDLFEDKLRTNLAAMLFDAEEPGEGLYLTDWQVVSVADYNAYQLAVTTYKAALSLMNLLDEATALGKDVAAEKGVYENTESTLQELLDAIDSVTNKLLEDEIGKASKDNPVDVTAKFITNPSYENNDNEGWSGTAPTTNAAANLQNAEFFNTTFNCYQDLRGLPEGYYKVSVQGFYRAGLEGPSLESKMSGNEASVMNVLLYITTNGKSNSTKLQSVFTGAPTEALGVDGEIHNGNWWVPNTMAAAAAYFAAGYYDENSLMVHVTSGQLRIGLRKSTTIRRDWTMFDNWRLTYYGKENPEE